MLGGMMDRVSESDIFREYRSSAALASWGQPNQIGVLFEMRNTACGV